MSYSLTEKEEQTSEVVGKIIELFVSIKGDTHRTSKTMITVDEEGVCGDKFYAKDPQRSILITTIQSYMLANKEGISMEYGFLGENIVMDYNPYNLLAGTQIRIGEVTLEISQHCTLCKSLSNIDSKLPKLLKDNRGIFAKVIHSGSIQQDDTISIISL